MPTASIILVLLGCALAFADAAGHIASPRASDAAVVLSRIGLDTGTLHPHAGWAVLGAPLLVIAALVLLLRRRRTAKSPRSSQQPGARTTGGTQRTTSSVATHPRKTNDSLSDKDQVLRFFFNLFKSQTGAAADAPTESVLAETRAGCPHEIHEMRVLHKGEWHSRRMSIGLLGQGGGSRSKCFYIIYDSHMVIKIPAEKIKDFDDYIRQIGVEGQITARLAPRECIVPRVSVILKAVQPLPDSGSLSAEELEKRYIDLLHITPALQDYLKIGKRFALFMDLARHFFLSATLDELHSRRPRLADEILPNAELLWDQNGFVCRYGEESAVLGRNLQAIYCSCEEKMKCLVEDAAIIEDVPPYRFKQWFLVHVAGETIKAEEQDTPPRLIGQINALLSGLLKKYRQPVEQYRSRIRSYLMETRFLQHRAQLENLASNMLDLLSWISERNLALRDLKPENLFVAGNPDDYPRFLNDRTKFSIGLIDVETAVVMDSDPIPQPQLAGTPLYATPSHLIHNKILARIYGDVRAILRVQDWWASMVIIYKIITGEHLFLTTARVFPEVIARLRALRSNAGRLEQEISKINALFWNSAAAEFREAVASRKGFLARTEVMVPAPLLPDIGRALQHLSDQLRADIAAIVSEQRFFTSADKRLILLDAPSGKIRQMKTKLQQEGGRAGNREDLLAFFERLELLKENLERKQDAAAAMNAAGAAIASDNLLEAMFQHVADTMVLPRWQPLSPAKWQGNADLSKDITTYQATM